MSRVGKVPIVVPAKAKVQIQGNAISVEGPKGKLSHEIPSQLAFEKTDSGLIVKAVSDHPQTGALHGLHRTLVQNMITGVLEGYSKELELSGVGYRAQVAGNKLEMFVGFTHPVIYMIPAGITVDAPKPTQLIVKGIDKQLVGQVAARIRAFAKPEPYKGKGIRYQGEVIRRKAGKAVA